MPLNRGYARYVISSTVVKLSDAPAAGVVVPGNAEVALIQNVDAANILSWRDDGGDPSATEGLYLRPGETLRYDGDMSKFKMIRLAAADVNSVRIHYYSD
jgi:hypothetical protein